MIFVLKINQLKFLFSLFLFLGFTSPTQGQVASGGTYSAESSGERSPEAEAVEGYLMFEVKTKLPRLSPNIDEAKNQALQYCAAFIAEFESQFLEKMPSRNSPYDKFCYRASVSIMAAQDTPSVMKVIHRMRTTANNIATQAVAKASVEIIGSLQKMKHDQSEIEEKNKVFAAQLAALKDGKTDEPSLLKTLGLRESMIRWTEQISLIFALIFSTTSLWMILSDRR